MAFGLLAHGRGFAGQHRLHDQTLDQADEAGGGGFGVQARADLSLVDRFAQLAEQQLAVALEHATHLELGRRVGGLLEFVEDEPGHARMRDDEFDMRPEHRSQRVQRRGGLVRRGLKLPKQGFAHPAHGGQPDGVLGGEVLEHRTLRDADRCGDVAGGDQRRARFARQTQGGFNDLGLAFFGGEAGLHAGRRIR
jgi:hypothetical protein